MSNSTLPSCLTEPQYFRFEGVWLTETGMAVLRNLSLSPLHKRRPRKATPTTPRPCNLNGEGVLEATDPLGPDEKKEGDVEAEEILKAEGLCYLLQASWGTAYIRIGI